MKSAFTESQFRLHPGVSDLELDTQVASRIANTVFNRNNQGNNTHNVRFDPKAPFTIDVNGESVSQDAPLLDGATDAAEWIAALHIPPGQEDTQSANALFAREMQRVLDKNERRSPSSGINAGVLGATGVMFLGGAAAIEMVFADAISRGGTAGAHAVVPAVLTAVIGAGAGGGILGTVAKQLHREVITNERHHRLNERHLRAAVEPVAKLHLPPLFARRG